MSSHSVQRHGHQNEFFVRKTNDSSKHSSGLAIHMQTDSVFEDRELTSIGRVPKSSFYLKEQERIRRAKTAIPEQVKNEERKKGVLQKHEKKLEKFKMKKSGFFRKCSFNIGVVSIPPEQYRVAIERYRRVVGSLPKNQDNFE